MSQINVNAGPPPSDAPPPRPRSLWPIYVVVAILAVVLLAALLLRRGGQQASSPPPTATATAGTARSSGGPTATVGAAGGSGGAATNTPAPGGATNTPASAATPQPPTNPTFLRAASGSCTVHRVLWTWTGAERATSYDVVLYDPQTGATVKNAVASTPAHTLTAGPGARVALKLRSRNAAGTAQGYFTPGSVGLVPPITTNPTAMTVATAGHTITFSYTGSRHATAYDVVLYHYSGGAAQTDITAHTGQGHWGTAVTPGVDYYLKVRSVGTCAPATYYTPPVHARVGA